MSKRLKNYPDPEEVMERISADALRLYLVNSPAVRAEPMPFKEPECKQVVSAVMLPWLNTIQFFVQQVLRHGTGFKRNIELAASSKNTLDMWILSRLNRLIKYMHAEMHQYHLYTVLPELLKFIDEMTNWYVRLNRDRLKDGADKDTAMAVLYEVIFNFTLMMCPFTPFFAEFCYQKLKPGLTEGTEEFQDSVHFLMLPQGDESFIKADIERRVAYMQSAIRIARLVRDKKKIPVRKPLAELTIICSPDIEGQITDLLPYIQMDVHVMKISFETDEKKYVKFSAQPDGRALGRKFAKKFVEVKKALFSLDYNLMANLYDQALEAQQKRLAGQNASAPTFQCCGETLNTDEVTMTRELIVPDPKKYFGSVDGEVAAFCDITDSPLILEITAARELRNRIQKARKDLGLKPTDKVTVYVDAPEGDNDVTNVIRSNKPEVISALGLKVELGPHEGDVIESQINDVKFKVIIFRH